MSPSMAPHFEDPKDQEIYVEWTELLEPVLDKRMYVHHDLYQKTHAHRREHGEKQCQAWPSPPYSAPMWPLLVEMTGARRFLEVGSALGYTAALMAEAGGAGSHVDTIESDRGHAGIAERELARKGLSERVKVLRGRAEEILPGLDQGYDIVFVDGGGPEVDQQLERFVEAGAVRVDKLLLRDAAEGIVSRLAAKAGDSPAEVKKSRAEARHAYRDAVARMVGSRRTGQG